MDKKNKIYQIGISSSEAEGVFLTRVEGTEKDVKKYLLKCLLEDKDRDPEKYDFGTDVLSDVEIDKDTGKISAYAIYNDYHIDYSAVPERTPINLSHQKNFILGSLSNDQEENEQDGPDPADDR